MHRGALEAFVRFTSFSHRFFSAAHTIDVFRSVIRLGAFGVAVTVATKCVRLTPNGK